MFKSLNQRSIGLTALAVTVLLVAAACGDDDSSSSAQPDLTVEPTSASTTAGAPTTTPAPDPTDAPETTDVPETTAMPATVPATTVPPTTAAAAPDQPTIVLVHGAFAGPASWDAVTALLEAEGFDVVVPTNPLRGPSADAAALRETLDEIVGDVVVVGHSYGGIPITNAATDDPDVRGLVYVAAYVPAEGETFGQIQERVPGQLTPDLLAIAPYTAPDGTEGTGATINVDAFPALFAADLPADQASTLASQQMPLDLAALGEPSGPPAWADIPSWYLVATEDLIIPAELARQMAETAGSTIEEVDASHAVLVSKPEVVADLIIRAAG